MRWWERTWVAGLIGLVAVTSFGVVGDVWPFAAWTMFSGLGPTTSDHVAVIAQHDDGTEQVHRGERLPGGFLRDRYQGRFERLDEPERRQDCRRMLASLRTEDEAVTAVRLERWEWSLTDREGVPASPDGQPPIPPDLEREELLTCR